MRLLNDLRDWWHQPVTDRLDRIESAVTPRPPGAYSATGRLNATLPPGTTADDLARSVTHQVRSMRRGGTWS